MTLREITYSSEGQRLLLASTRSPTEIHKLTGISRQSLSNWRGGRARPVEADQAKLEQYCNIPKRTWYEAPLTTSEPAAPAAVTTQPRKPQSADRDIRSLDDVVTRLTDNLAGLSPKDTTAALSAISATIAKRDDIALKRTTKRDEYLASPEFVVEARELAALLPASSDEFRRACLLRGIELPHITQTAAVRRRAAPRKLDDLDSIITDLETARDLATHDEIDAQEEFQLRAEIDTHADSIAALLVRHPEYRDRLIPLLNSDDLRTINAAMDRQRVIASAVDAAGAEVVANLLSAIGCDELAQQLR